MLRHLQEHHGWILALLRDADALYAQPQTPPSASYLATRRNAMGRLLTAYQRCVHRELFDPAIDTGDAQDAALARAVKIDCIDLVEGFRAFNRRWIAEDAVERWDEYRPEALRIVERLRRHVREVDAIARRLSASNKEKGGGRLRGNEG
ncbi:hypothetical protein LK533_05560 [Sphingomonas sp. PL-96]|uniref:hypothetical protein n=1 Tax=Sphingomonas sp. PL-96 TaxID=2887201 RepID=UPI001E39A4F5|nr:hypothetical protein [Sphingomonas sp. PL-96]MCC2976141.1 hypothetical protein [Sphingomonas sp. PL-96]